MGTDGKSPFLGIRSKYQKTSCLSPGFVPRFPFGFKTEGCGTLDRRDGLSLRHPAKVFTSSHFTVDTGLILGARTA
jgi:hypothetical protein